MAGAPAVGGLVYAKDVERVAAFYASVASLAVAHAEPGYIVLDSDALELVVHGLPRFIAEEIEIAVPPVLREETPIKLLLPVESLAAARERAAAAGGGLAPAEPEWEAGGVRACDGWDPEGNVVQLRQRVGYAH